VLLAECLPADWRDARLLGRVLTKAGPSPVLARGGRLYDLSNRVATTAQAVAFDDLDTAGVDLGSVDELTVGSAWLSDPDAIQLLSPLDLQCIKASGVTFAVSALERVIEERARGDADAANAVRQSILDRIGGDLKDLRPGSEQAEAVKAQLIAEGLWSQYLEVAIGPYAEIFTKAPPMSSVGWGDYVGIRTQSTWNNPEPEVVIVVDRTGKAIGATLGNDVNLRDYEGRSALLLGKAKDNNAASALGPFIRMFDDKFSIDHVRNAVVELEIVGTDNYRLEGKSTMTEISRDPLELVKQTISEHQYPDGFVLYCGTLFAPTQDRDTPGFGFTHKEGDVVRVSTAKLGVLENRVTTCKQAPPWNFGIADLMKNLLKRGLLKA